MRLLRPRSLRTRCTWIAVITLATVVSAVLARASIYPLRISDDRRYLVDQNGEPFFIANDASWSLLYRFSRAEVVTYLDRRREQGFNTVKCNAIPWDAAGDEAGNTNTEGNEPFLHGDPGRPNEPYWALADWVFARAAERGIQLLLETPELFRAVSTPEQAEAIGRFLGARYRQTPNLIWLHGSDRHVSGADAARVTALVRGIRSRDTTHLHTFHPGAGQDSREGIAELPDQSWLGLNWAYAYRPECAYGKIQPYARSLRSFRKEPVMPVYLGESGYEAENTPTINTPAIIRRQAYWSVLSGCTTGHTYGHLQIWLKKPGWRAALDAPGAADMAVATAFFRSLPWHRLRPDIEHPLVTGGRGVFNETERPGGDDYVAAAVTEDGEFAVVYLPPHQSAARSITLDLTGFRDDLIEADWFDPCIGVSAHRFQLTRGSMQTVTAPGPNADGESDWILVLRSAGSGS